MHADADFLAAVAANPQDQLTRLVYADWLDEQGDPRGELVRIEEEARFEPAWSDVLWSQKPRRNELRAKCDPAWLMAMRYGTDCLPLFYGRPFPDHWRDGWRLIREATERWLGVPMPDVGGHADEVAVVEKRLGLTLPPSVREFVAFAHDMPQDEPDWICLFRDAYWMRMVPGHEAVSLVMQCEGDLHHAIQAKELAESNPPVTPYRADGGDRWRESAEATDPKNSSLTRFFFNYAVGYASDDFAHLYSRVAHVAEIREQLRQSFPFHTEFDSETLYETANIVVRLRAPASTSPGFLDVRISRPVRDDDIPDFLWEYARDSPDFLWEYARNSGDFVAWPRKETRQLPGG